ncbi:MAG: 2-succinyl-5-enolpyruvyl-6-hydroxy-3-cyclohexene-1-carboxylic-acid synthase [Crocinitomicaceae bacterium]|nr:2-succinyl-5-enolpyruvyl-6-hydroxy-3-cyclohexene-1-carboxylic-acid synthase [Crocinitomicaceae bacterium]
MGNYQTSDHRGASVLVAQLAASGLKHVVISPGSRNAPLTIAFDAHPQIKTHVVVDERSAAHVALGLGLETGIPAAVICTSGTAAINHGPAMAEAFHHRITLISITADRPTSVIGKGHGQSVFQTGVFGKNCKHSVVIDELEMSDEAIIVETAKAFIIASKGTSVHINVPFEEPLYGLLKSSEDLNLIGASNSIDQNIEIPEELCKDGAKILLVAGSIPFYKRRKPTTILPGICEKFSGLSGQSVIHSADMLMAQNGGVLPDELAPEIVITLGTPTLSKSFRNYLISQKPKHFHVGDTGKGWDTWGELAKTIDADTSLWLEAFEGAEKIDKDFASAWAKLEKSANTDGLPWSDLKAFDIVLKATPENARIHLSNSTSARYVQMVDTSLSKTIHCNRGVAGIDGCTSTAVGNALNSEAPVVIITGDVAFQYDLNGLATIDEVPGNLRVVVINNGGGEIFRWLDGPESMGLVDKYFETKPRTSVKAAAEYCGLNYFCARNQVETQKAMDEMMQNNAASILEVITDGLKSTEVYKTILSKK